MKSAKTNLSIICESISEVAHYAKLDNSQFRLLKSCLPGPYTFLLPALSKLPKAFKGRRIVGIRIPDNPIAKGRGLIRVIFSELNYYLYVYMKVYVRTGFQRGTLWSVRKKGFLRGKGIEIPFPLNLLSFRPFLFK